MLFDIKNAIVSLFKNCLIKLLEYQSNSKSKLKPKSEESIPERTKIRRQIIDENAKKEKTIDLDLFNYYFKYSSDTGSNKVKVDFIKNDMTNLKKDIENVSKDGVDKIEKMNKIADIVELILYFNNEDQEGTVLKILTPSQMPRRLPIFLAQLNAGNNSEKLKKKLGNYCILCKDRKNLQKICTKVWLTLFKDGNNLFEH